MEVTLYSLLDSSLIKYTLSHSGVDIAEILFVAGTQYLNR